LALRRLVTYRESFGAKAPITEALVDIHVQTPPNLSLEALRSFNEAFTATYPEVRTQTEWAGQIRIEPDAHSSTLTSRHGVRGYVFLDALQKRVIQVRRDGFTFSRLAPYDSWESLREEAKVAWRRYVEITRPVSARRVALRYINYLSLPAGELQLPDWFRLHSSTPDELGSLTEMLIRIAFQHPDDPSYAALVTLGSAPPKNPPESGFLFDIDARVTRDFGLDESIWNALEDLHEYKNDVFFGSLTEDTFARIRR
jgi:uncharacterized protein (TIGR04255 family)